MHDALPDSACTPGAIFPDITAEQVCQRGYSSSVRNVPAEVSREVYREYGIAERTTGEYEVDHLEPLELAGSNDIANLWPEAAEPRPGVPRKRPGRELPSRSGVRWRDESAGGAGCDCQQLAGRLPATAAAGGRDPGTDVGASSAAGARDRCPTQLRRRRQAGWPRERRRTNDAWSFLLHLVPDPGRHVLNSSGIDSKDGGWQRHGLLDLGDRDVNPPGHRDGSSHLQWRERA